MHTERIKLSRLKVNENNPRTISKEKFDKLVDSILVFPNMLSVRPIVVDEEYHALGGNMITEALREIGKISLDAIVERLNSMREYNDLPEFDKENLIGFWKAWLSDKVVDVVNVKGFSDEEKRQFVIKDNLGYGEWDWDMLSNEWDVEQLKDWGVDLPDDFSVEGENNEVQEDDFTEEDEKDVETRVKAGDIWQLGEHRLMCGDSTDKECVERLMNGEKADMVFTDPPYGMKKESDGVMNDNLNFDDLLEFNKKWIPITFENTKDNGSWYCWGIDEPLMDIYSNILKPMIRQNKVTFRNLITWDKGNGQGQMSDEFRMYPIADEKCLFVMRGMQSNRVFRNEKEYNFIFEPIRSWFEEEKKKSGLSTKKLSEIDSSRVTHYWAKTQFEFPTKDAYERIKGFCSSNDIEAFQKNYNELKIEYNLLKNECYFDNTHDNMNNVWHFDRTSEEERELTGEHATPKPIALCARGIKSSSREGEIVLDVFGGSGSTLIDCEQLNRKCRMIELSEHYCDVIIARWEKLTGKEAVKIYG